MIAVEGVDHVGKTTLVNAICDALAPDQPLHSAPARQTLVQKWSQLPPTFDYYCDYLKATTPDQPPIMDRFCVSELAYGPVYRGHVDPRFDSHAQRQVARALNAAGAIHVRVHAPWSTVKPRLERVPDELVKCEQHFRDLTAEFDRSFLTNLALGEHGVKWMPTLVGRWHPRPGLNTGEGGLARTRQYAAWVVETWRAGRARVQAFRELDSQSWGTLDKRKVLLVGEQVNPRGKGWGVLPFSGYCSSSSRMVTRMLDAGQVPEGDVHIVNAYRANGDRMHEELIEFLDPAVIIPLGKAASDVIEVLGYGHLVAKHKFPHPQWISRFRNREFHKWGERLAAAMTTEGS